MNIYGNIPRVGDRVAVVMLVRSDTRSWMPLPAGAGVSGRRGLTNDSIKLVEGVVIQQYTSNGGTTLERAQYLGALGVAVPTADGNGIHVVTFNYEGYGVRTVINALRNLEVFHRFDDAQLIQLACLSYPQPIADSQYVRMIKDIRGDDAVPASIAMNRAQAEETARSLGIAYLAAEHVDTYCTRASMAIDGEDEDYVEAFVEEFERRPRLFASGGFGERFVPSDDAPASYTMDIEQRAIASWSNTLSTSPVTSTPTTEEF